MVEKKYEFWADKVAKEIIEREEKLNRGIKVFRTESGLGASGFPHIGSYGDVIRNYAVALALKDHGVKAELIAYSDDRDGLRKVPLGLPNWLEKHIGMPVTDIPDPFKCHDSYGEHMRNLLLESLDKSGVEYKHHSGTEDYRKGLFNEQIEKILLNAKRVGEIVKELLGQEKFLQVLPYFPVCENCGRIYTTRAYELIPGEHKVLYVCDQEFIGKNLNTGKKIVVKGCGHRGEASYFNGTGKMSWKAEFGMRWAALQIIFEAHGKDILDSVKVNDKISKEILGFEPPIHLMYEMFLDKGGRKISKSYGNVFTPQVWFRYGNPQSLILLMLKRFSGTREIGMNDVPIYMEEVDRLERIYFNLEKVENERDLINLKRLFEFIHFLNPPKKPRVQLDYFTMVELAKILPERNKLDFVIQKLREMGKIKEVDEEEKRLIEERLNYAINWVKDAEEEKEVKVEISEKERNGIRELIEAIKEKDKGEELQAKIFEIARKNGIQIKDFFKTLYLIILGKERGPRLGPYIIEAGKEDIIGKLERVLKEK